MRILLIVLLLLPLLAAPASAQGPSASIQPLAFAWDDYSRSNARFDVRVTNPGAQADAYTITRVAVTPAIANLSVTYSPSPTIPLGPGASGTFHVWIGGFEQPSPPGPPAGNYTIAITVQSSLDPNREQRVDATIRRTHPPVTGFGVLTGSVRDSLTGELPTAFGPLRLSIHDAQSVRRLDPAVSHRTLASDGTFRFELPPGEYWLRAEASGYRTTYVGPLTLAEGSESSADIAISPNTFGRFQSQAPRTVTTGLPTYRLAGSVDLSSVATVPGGYNATARTDPPNLFLMGADATARWSRALAAPSPVPLDAGYWDSTHHGVDVSRDAFRVAAASAGGAIEIFGGDGKTVGTPYRGTSDVNPLVPGPLGQGMLRSNEVRFSHDGTRMAGGSLTGWIYYFDAINGTLVWKTPTMGQVRALRFSPDDARLYAASGDNFLYALNAQTGAVLWKAPLQHYPDGYIAMTNDGTLVLLGGRDGSLRLINQAGQQEWIKTLPGPILGFDIAPGGSQAVALTAQGVYSFNRNGDLRWFRGESNASGSIRFGDAGSYIGYGRSTSSSSEPAMRILTSDGTLAWEYRVPQGDTVHNVLPVDDGSRIVANGRSGTVYFFDFWTMPATGTRGPATGDESPTTRTGGGSPGVGVALLLVTLAWVAWRRREA